MTDCPNCSTDIMPESYPVRVDNIKLIKHKALQFSNFNGVESAQPIGENTIKIHIIQSSYNTNNHFRNRQKFADMPHIDVEDIKKGIVHLTLDTQQIENIVTAFRCPKCDHIWDSELGDLNSATPVI